MTSGPPVQIQCITDNVDSGRTASYSYDSLYRLTNATTNGSTNYPKWGLSMTYDRYGNRTAQQIVSGCTGLTCPTNSVTVSASTNQITGSPYGYDANGNMTNDGQNTLVYDGENRALSATNGSASGTYTYDGNNLRVKKVSGSTTTVYIFSGSKVIAEYDNGAAVGSPSREYVYSGGSLLAKIDSSGTNYYQQDQLSNRLVTDSSGNTIAQQGHFPFGEQWYPAPPTAPPSKWLFTSYERDSESSNDYALMRSYVNRLARFSSPDLLGGSIDNPQSLNLYAYTLNDPANMIDPLGLDTIAIFGDGTCMENPDGPGWICLRGTGNDGSTGLPLIYRPGADHGGGGGNTSGGASQTQQVQLSPAAQACVAQANQQVQNQLQTFSGYAGTKLIGRAALGAFSGAMTSFWRFSKTGNPWVVATGATVGAAVGGVSSMYSDSRTIQKIQNSFMDKFAACMQNASAPKPPE